MREVQRAGGRLSQHPACLDANHIYVPAGKQVRVYEQETGQLIKAHDYAAPVTSVALEGDRLLVALANGEIRANETLVASLNEKVYEMQPQSDGSLLLWTLRPAAPTRAVQQAVESRQQWLKRQGATAEQLAQVQEQALERKLVGRVLRLPVDAKQAEPLGGGKVMAPRAGVALAGSQLAVANGRRVLVGGNELEFDAAVCSLAWLSHDRDAVDNGGSTLLVGDERGRVHLVSTGAKARRQVFHWHAHPVTAMAACPGGQHFLTGGTEGVLVHWDAGSGGERRFLPRLAAAIEWIRVSPNGAVAALGLADNSIQLVSIGPLSLLNGGLHGLPVEPTLFLPFPDTVVAVSGVPGALLLFDPLEDRLVGELDLGRQNLVGGGTPSQPLAYFVMRCAARHGPWLAIYETRETTAGEGENRLSFWEQAGKAYRLVYSVDAVEEIKAMAFLPHDGQQQQLVTVGKDWCRWQLATLPAAKERVWAQTGRGCLLKGVDCTAVAVSADGSLLAMAQGPAIALVRANGDESLAVLATKKPVKQLLFVGDHLLVSLSEDCVTVWDLLTLSPCWQTRVPAQSVVAPLPSGEWLLALAGQRGLHVLRFAGEGQPEPVQRLCLAEGGRPLSIASLGADRFCVLLHGGQVVTLALGDETPSVSKRAEAKTAPLAALLATAPPPRDIQVSGKRAHLPPANLKMASLAMLTTPSHLLPPMADIYAHYLGLRGLSSS